MAEVRSLAALLVDCVQDLLADEQVSAARLPALAGHAEGAALKAAVLRHAGETLAQAERLERAAASIGASGQGPACLWAEGILNDAGRDTETVARGPLLDAALIGALRKLEHAEIVSYETAIGVAARLGHAEVVALLEACRGEEAAMDAELRALLDDAIARG